MAITITKQPPIHTGAFGKNVILTETNDPTVNRFKYSLSSNSVVQAVQYSIIFAYQGVISLSDPNGLFDIGGIYSSILPYYNNPIIGVDIPFLQVNAIHHQKNIDDIITEDKIGGASTTINRTIFKAVDVKYNINNYWLSGGSQNFLAYLRDENNLVQREAFNNQYIPISYYTTTTTGIYIQRENVDNTINLGLTNINQRYRLARWKVTSNHVLNNIKITNGTTELKLIVDFDKHERTQSLYFLNRFGGWEWFNFINYETKQRVDKNEFIKYKNIDGDLEINTIINNSTKELKLFGKDVMKSSIYYLKDLLTSPIILDKNGERVRIVNNNLEFDGDGIISPEVTIQYIQEKTINF